MLSHIHFENKRLEKFRQTADHLMQAYVGFYEQEDLADTEKINRVVTAVVAELKARGFVVNEANVRAIFTAVAKIVKENSAQQRKSS